MMKLAHHKTLLSAMYTIVLVPLSQPHWGNTCPQISQYLIQRNSFVAKRRVTKEEYAMEAFQTDTRETEPPTLERIQGYDV